MKDSESKFKDWLSNAMPEYSRGYREFDGNVMELSDFDKDFVCKSFLDCFPSWIDDLVPPCAVDQQEYLNKVYEEGSNCTLKDLIRGYIYLELESKLDELMREVWAEYRNAKPEPFPGYEVGQ